MEKENRGKSEYIPTNLIIKIKILNELKNQNVQLRELSSVFQDQNRPTTSYLWSS